MITINGLTKIYKGKNETKALNNVSLKLPDKGFVFIFGQSGSGKSTLLNLIGGLDDITEGEIFYNNLNIKEFTSSELDIFRSNYLGFIFQDFNLYDNMTVYQNVLCSLELSNNKSKDILDILKKVGLEGLDGRYITELSGGERQRVAIARALIKDSSLILADEPTGNLDPNTSIQILDLLKEISNEKLVIMVSHNKLDGNLYADRIIELSDGCVISDKTRRDNYQNEFEINNDEIILPSYKDLTNDEILEFNEVLQSGNVKKITQLDNGFDETKNIIETKKEIELKKNKVSILSLFKFLKMFMLKRKYVRIFSILIIVLIFIVSSLMISFITYKNNTRYIHNDADYYVLSKGSDKPFENSVHYAPLYEIDDNDISAFNSTNYKGNVYKLNNYSFTINGSSNYILHKMTNDLRSIEDFYLKSTYGTLVCDDSFFNTLFKGNEVIKTDYKDYGILVTDYVADSMMYYVSNQYKSYNDILGYKKINPKEYYINGIIKTNYKEKYKDIISLYEKDKNTAADKARDLDIYEEFLNDVNKRLGVTYSLNPNFLSDLYEYDNAGVTINTYTFSSNDYNYKRDSSAISFYIDKSINDDEIILNYSLYNKIFNTNYTMSNYKIENHTVKLEMFEYNNRTIYEKEFKIKSLSYENKVSENVYSELNKNTIVNIGLYLDNLSNSYDVIDKMCKYNFYLLEPDFYSELVIWKVSTSFQVLITCLLVVLILVLFIYVVMYGINNIKSNYKEIGIYKSLGGKYRHIGITLIMDALITCAIIWILCFIFTKTLTNFSNYVLTKAFESILNIKIYSTVFLQINNITLFRNLSILLVIMLVASIIPFLLLRRLKPIKILKY